LTGSYETGIGLVLKGLSDNVSSMVTDYDLYLLHKKLCSVTLSSEYAEQVQDVYQAVATSGSLQNAYVRVANYRKTDFPDESMKDLSLKLLAVDYLKANLILRGLGYYEKIVPNDLLLQVGFDKKLTSFYSEDGVYMHYDQFYYPLFGVDPEVMQSKQQTEGSSIDFPKLPMKTGTYVLSRTRYKGPEFDKAMNGIMKEGRYVEDHPSAVNGTSGNEFRMLAELPNPVPGVMPVTLSELRSLEKDYDNGHIIQKSCGEVMLDTTRAYYPRRWL
jgi:hypothetical protein